MTGALPKEMPANILEDESQGESEEHSDEESERESENEEGSETNNQAPSTFNAMSVADCDAVATPATAPPARQATPPARQAAPPARQATATASAPAPAAPAQAAPAQAAPAQAAPAPAAPAQAQDPAPVQKRKKRGLFSFGFLRKKPTGEPDVHQEDDNSEVQQPAPAATLMHGSFEPEQDTGDSVEDEEDREENEIDGENFDYLFPTEDDEEIEKRNRQWIQTTIDGESIKSQCKDYFSIRMIQNKVGMPSGLRIKRCW